MHSEKDATLTIKSEAGVAFVTLSLDLGHVLAPPLQRPRNGPSRQRRHAKREEAHRVATEVAESDETEKVLDSVEAEEATTDVTKNDENAAVNATTDVEADAETVTKVSIYLSAKNVKHNLTVLRK